MAETLQPVLPPDKLIKESDGSFKGSGFVYRKTDIGLAVEEIKFDIHSPTPLNPFFYNRPIEDSSNPFNQPLRFVKDSSARSGYFPLAQVKQVLRPPNHLYEIDDAIFAATNRGTEENPKWETRYFPKNSLEPLLWEEAMTMLNRNNSQVEFPA